MGVWDVMRRTKGGIEIRCSDCEGPQYFYSQGGWELMEHQKTCVGRLRKDREAAAAKAAASAAAARQPTGRPGFFLRLPEDKKREYEGGGGEGTSGEGSGGEGSGGDGNGGDGSGGSVGA